MRQNTHIQGSLPVLLALLGNTFITVIKFGGFFLSGSGAIFSEAVHSTADTINQGLLFVGLRGSVRDADEHFAYGYGKERFFWALISACGIFFLGAGVTIYHGIELLLTREVPHIQPILFWILLISFVVEGVTFLFAVRELRRHYPNHSTKDIIPYWASHTDERKTYGEYREIPYAPINENASQVLQSAMSVIPSGREIRFRKSTTSFKNIAPLKRKKNDAR